MSLLLETIQIKNREFQNLEYHQHRVDRSRRILFGSVEKMNLLENIEIPESLKSGMYKCRVVYSDKIYSVEFLTYNPKAIKTLKLIRNNGIDYAMKYHDRKSLENLFDLRSVGDDILIVKNNLITDTSFCNILFYNDAQWFTPEKPLLEGTQRQKLLDEGRIKTCNISPDNLFIYQKFMLINAMLEFDESRAVANNAEAILSV